MYIEQTSCSCGVFSLSGLSMVQYNPKKFITDFYKTLKDKRNYTIVFSDNDRGNGNILENLIRNNHLGSLVCNERCRNPNTDNMIRTWLWTLNCYNIRKYIRSK